MTAAFYVLYGLLVLTVTVPLRTEAFFSGYSARRSRAGDSAAFLFALVSAYALPWGGVPLIPSAVWFPASATALLLLSARDERRGARPALRYKALAILCGGIFYGGMACFMLRIGTPGALFSIEGMSAVFRLESLGGWLIPASAAFFAGFALSLASLGLRDGLPASLFFFSCAGFLTNTFLPPILSLISTAAGGEPPLALALRIVAAFIVSAALGKMLYLSQERTDGARRAAAGASVCLVLGGCAFLAVLAVFG